MTERPAAPTDDAKPADAGDSDRLAGEAGAGSPKQAAPSSPSQLHHEFANTLHGILLQVRCAEWAIDKGNVPEARENLAQIELAVNQSRHLLRKLTASDGQSTTNGDG